MTLLEPRCHVVCIGEPINSGRKHIGCQSASELFIHIDQEEMLEVALTSATKWAPFTTFEGKPGRLNRPNGLWCIARCIAVAIAIANVLVTTWQDKTYHRKF